MASRRHLRLRSSRAFGAVAAALASCVACLLLLGGTVHALDPNKHVTQYIHKSWRIQDGYVPAGMLSVAQTSDGFLWLTSLSQGLYRFDGVQFVPWALTVGGKTIDLIVSVYAGHGGGLWALDGDEIVHVKAGVVTSRFQLQAQQRTQYIADDPHGSLWVVQAGYGIEKPLCHVTEQAMNCFGESDGVPRTGAEAILADGNGGFWLGGQRAIVHWHVGGSEVYAIDALKSNPADGVAALAFDSNATLWVGIVPNGPGQGLGRFDRGVFKSFVGRGLDGSKLSVIAIKLDRDGGLWVGTLDNGLFRIRGNMVEHFGRAEGLSSDSVNGIFEDREGILWITTSNGIDSFRDPPVTTFSALEGLTEDSAVGVLPSKDGGVWVGNAESLDHIDKDGVATSIRRGKGLPGEQVSAMFEDRDGNVFMGVGYELYLFANGRFHRIAEPGNQPLGLVLAITEDTAGNIWAACSGRSRKLVRIRDFQIREQFSAAQVPIGHLAADPHGGIWIAAGDGTLALFRNGVLKKIPIGSGTTKFLNHQLLVQASGSVLAAYDDGVVGLREGRVQRMTKKNGLPCNAVYALIQDKGQRWWLNTQCGIVEFPDSELQRWWSEPDTVIQTKVYDALDGARPDQFGITPAALSSDGRVWFATGYVVQMLDPSKLSKNALPAVTYVESITADRKQYTAANNLRLPPHPRDLQIDYTSPTFATPQRVKFRYRLDGFDRDWHDAGTRRQAFYTDLPPGKYTFRVTACSSEGVWDNSPAQLNFSVAPAYYQTKWFRAFCAFAFLGLLWAAYQWRVRHLQREFEMTLDARVGERTRIARELHDTLLQSFHGVLLRFQTVFQILPERAVEAKEKLGIAIDQAAEAITEGRDAVQGLRDSVIQGNDLALAISALGEELASSIDQPPAFRVAVEGESRNLHPILRDETYKIATEALRNTFRHAGARQVEVEIRYDNEQFRLRVRDDGKGINPALLAGQGGEGHYGLPGMRERAKLIEAKLTIWSEVDSGTEIELRVPASIAYTKSKKRSWFSEAFAAKKKA